MITIFRIKAFILPFFSTKTRLKATAGLTAGLTANRDRYAVQVTAEVTADSIVINEVSLCKSRTLAAF